MVYRMMPFLITLNYLYRPESDPNSRKNHYSTLNVSETVRDRDIVQMEYQLEFTHALLNGVISHDF